MFWHFKPNRLNVFASLTVIAKWMCQNISTGPFITSLTTFESVLKMGVQVYLHGKVLPTASMCTVKGLLSLMVSQYVTLQIEATRENFITPFSGTHQLPLLPSRVDTQLMLAQEPGIAKQLFAFSTRHLDYKHIVI